MLNCNMSLWAHCLWRHTTPAQRVGIPVSVCQAGDQGILVQTNTEPHRDRLYCREWKDKAQTKLDQIKIRSPSLHYRDITYNREHNTSGALSSASLIHLPLEVVQRGFYSMKCPGWHIESLISICISWFQCVWIRLIQDVKFLNTRWRQRKLQNFLSICCIRLFIGHKSLMQCLVWNGWKPGSST